MTTTAPSPGFSRRSLLQAGLGAATVVGLGACSRSVPPSVDRLRLATGPAGAVYREIGAALATVWKEAFGSDVVQTVHTEAAVDNAARLGTGEAELGFVNVDVAQTLAEPFPALLRVFDSVLHLLVPADSPIRTIDDLQGRTVAMGLPGSGSRFTADRLLQAAGLDLRSAGVSQAEAATALAAGEVEAMFSLTAMPTPAITGLLESAAEYRFIDLAEPLRSLQQAHPGEYLSVTIGPAVYPGVASAAGVAVATLLVCGRGLSEELVEFLTSTVIAEAPRLRALRPEAEQINLRTAVATAPVPLHPGAAAYYRMIKP